VEDLEPVAEPFQQQGVARFVVSQERCVTSASSGLQNLGFPPFEAGRGHRDLENGSDAVSRRGLGDERSAPPRRVGPIAIDQSRSISGRNWPSDDSQAIPASPSAMARRLTISGTTNSLTCAMRPRCHFSEDCLASTGLFSSECRSDSLAASLTPPSTAEAHRTSAVAFLLPVDLKTRGGCCG
jgi:hypothetical protein